jgi:pyridoxamine 5'-phosphate oxidase
VERDLTSWRTEYAAHGLDVDDLPEDPIDGVISWIEAARFAGVHEPNATILSTVGPDRQVSSRMVLIKAAGAAGFTFYTNYRSRKASELDSDSRCALLFPWHALQRQVRVDGAAQRVPRDESDAYFATRPREAQLGAWASPQSAVIGDRADLDEAYAKVAREFEGRRVPRPPYWGGYRVRPGVIEFWQGRYGRMHDRLRYRRHGEEWTVERLAP